jgi:hypothetical protein
MLRNIHQTLIAFAPAQSHNGQCKFWGQTCEGREGRCHTPPPVVGRMGGSNFLACPSARSRSRGQRKPPDLVAPPPGQDLLQSVGLPALNTMASAIGRMPPRAIGRMPPPPSKV